MPFEIYDRNTYLELDRIARHGIKNDCEANDEFIDIKNKADAELCQTDLLDTEDDIANNADAELCKTPTFDPTDFNQFINKRILVLADLVRSRIKEHTSLIYPNIGKFVENRCKELENEYGLNDKKKLADPYFLITLSHYHDDLSKKIEMSLKRKKSNAVVPPTEPSVYKQLFPKDVALKQSDNVVSKSDLIVSPK